MFHVCLFLRLQGTDPAQSFGQSCGGSQLASCVRNVFGTPSYPSPLDRIRTGKRERAVQLGLTPTAEESFELNQSFPKRCRSRHGVDIDFTPDSKKKLGDFTGSYDLYVYGLKAFLFVNYFTYYLFFISINKKTSYLFYKNGSCHQIFVLL